MAEKLKWDNLPAGTQVEITGDHPHKGEKATFVYRTDTKSAAGMGNLFIGKGEQRFYVYDEKHVKYV